MTTRRVPGSDLAYAAIGRIRGLGRMPLVPASAERCADFLAATGRPPDEVIGRLEQLRREVTVEFAARSALMAGCLPERFPVVLAAWDALMLERAVVDDGWQITSGRAPLVVVNGPVRHRLGFSSTAGVPGSGSSANSTVARAIGLIVLNGYGVRPPAADTPTWGAPGSWAAICLAENEEESPWEPLSSDGDLSPGTDGVSATLMRSFEHVGGHDTLDPEALLAEIADALTRTGLPVNGNNSAGLLLTPAHARLLGDAGLAKHDVRSWLVERCQRLFEADSPKDLMIVVAGEPDGPSTVVRLVSAWSQVTARVEQHRTRR